MNGVPPRGWQGGVYRATMLCDVHVMALFISMAWVRSIACPRLVWAWGCPKTRAARACLLFNAQTACMVLEKCT
jgi:hypothetical protein